MYFQAVDFFDTAQQALATGRFTEARVLLESHGSDARANALLARVYAQLKLPQKAQAAAMRAAQLGGNIPSVQHTLALFYAQSGQRKLAAEWEGRYARSGVADAAASARAAMLFAETGQWKEVAEFASAALAGQERPELRNILARAYESLSRNEEAVTEYRQLLALLPYDEPTHAAFGQALLRMGRFQEAAVHLEESRKKFDKSPQIELALGVAYYTQRRFAEAGERFLRVIELDAEISQSYIFLVRMIDQLPEQVPAIRARTEAWYRKEAVNGFAPYAYAKALQAAGAPDAEMKPLLLEALRRDRKVWEFPFELGQLFERQRDFAAARAHYETAIALNGRIPETHYHLARVYDRLQQPAKAERERALHKQLLTESGQTKGMQ